MVTVWEKTVACQRFVVEGSQCFAWNALTVRVTQEEVMRQRRTGWKDVTSTASVSGCGGWKGRGARIYKWRAHTKREAMKLAEINRPMLPHIFH
jgi:hypothetical protein